MMNAIPDQFIQRMRSQLGEELPAFLNALDDPPLRGIRINPLKESTGCARYKETEAVPWAEQAWYLPEDSEAGATVLHTAGAFYIQEPAAMIPVAVLKPKPDERILDMCAAPGGKSTQIGCVMQGKGLLVANEPVSKRARILSGNIERIGLPNTIVTNAWPEQLAEKWREGFDAVLVDAPCSGEGMFRRDPETRTEWTAEKADGCAARQREILRAASELVRPGGRLVYSTCTYNPKENEDNAAWFCETFPDCEPETFSLPGINAPKGVFTCYPHRIKGEGQFIALFRKKGNSLSFLSEDRSLPLPNKDMIKVFRSIFPMLPEPTHLLANTMIHLPFMPDIQGIHILRAGLHLGEIRGKTAVPDHAAAMCFHMPEIKSLDLEPEQVSKYLSGETIPGDTEGWTLLRYQQLAVGWGKGNGGIIKNHYPKGLRGAHFLP